MAQRVAWTLCIDADLSKLNFFHQCMLFYVSTIDQRLIFVVTILIKELADALDWRSRVHKLTTAPSLDQYLQRVEPHAPFLMLAVEYMAGDAGSHHLPGSQTQKPPHLPHGLSCRAKKPSLAWIFALAMLSPDYIVVAAKFNHQEIRDFLVKITAAFFSSTMEMLKDAKSKDIHEEKWLILNERLMTIFILIQYEGNIRLRLEETFLQWMERALMTTHETPKEWVSYVAVVKDVLGRYEAADNNHGWDHLRQFIQHWLDRLQKGSTGHREIKIRLTQLTELCGLVTKQNSHSGELRTDCEYTPYSEPDNSKCKVADRTLDTFEKLRGQTPMDKAAVSRELLAYWQASCQDGLNLYQLKSLVRISTSQSLQDRFQIMAIGPQRSDSNMRKACKTLPLPKHLKYAIRYFDTGMVPDVTVV